MKLCLVLWAVGLAASDKLDRTYLPPPGSIASGGHLKDLNLPLEFAKETYPSTLGNENNRNTINDFSRPNYPNVAIGIDRQGPSVTSTPPGIPFSKNILNESSKTKPYAFAQTTTLSPAEADVSIVGQGYTSTTSPFDPNLNYPKQDGFINDRQQSGVGFDSKISDVSPQTAYTGQSTSIFNVSPDLQSPHSSKIQHDLASDFLIGYGGPVSSRLIPQDFSVAHNYPSDQYGGDLDSTIKEAISTASTPSDNYYNQQKPKTYKDKNQQNYAEDVYYSTPKIKNNFDEENSSYDPINTGAISPLAPNQYPDGISSTLGPIRSFSKFSTPKYSLDNLDSTYNTQAQPERIQAAADKNAVINNYENILTPEGYAYSYDTSNGIHADESGTAINGVKAQGSYSYIGDDGQVYSIVYTADENGFLPRGDHLPTAPPIPKAILKVIEEAEKNKQLGVIDDGTYDGSKYGYERYEGSLGRKPHVPFSSNDREQSMNNGNLPNIKTITIETEGYPNNEKHLDQELSSDKVGTMSGSRYPFNAENVNGNDYYTNEIRKQFSISDHNQPSNRGLLRTDKIKATDNQFITRPINKSIDSSEIISRPSGAHHSDYIANNPKIGLQSSNNGLPSDSNIIIPEKQAAIHNMRDDLNINLPSHTGYEYTRPQQKFNNNYGNNYASIFQNGPSKFNNRVSDKNYEDPTVVTERVFSTSKPEYGVTTSNYQYPYTAKVIDDHRHYDYPTSTLRSSYTPSTTRLPSKFSPSLPPSTIGLDYHQTTPITSQFSSTVPPSVASNIFGSSTLRPTIGVGSNYGQRPNKEYRVSTTRPDIAERINGKPRYRGRPKIPVTINENTPQPTSTQDGINPGFASEHKAHNFKTSPQPENYRGQPTTERVIGEDFNGPKQSQRFDPEHGYYY